MEDSSILLFLKQSMVEKVIVSIFSNRNQPDACSVGYVEAITEDQVLLNHVTPTGLADGIVIRRLEDVFRVDINGLYEQKLHRLYFLQHQSHQTLLLDPANTETNLFNEILIQAQKLGLIVNVCIDETETQDNIIGLTKEVSKFEVVISRISEYGLVDGESILLLDDIVKLNCDTDEEHILKLLYQDNKDSNRLTP